MRGGATGQRPRRGQLARVPIWRSPTATQVTRVADVVCGQLAGNARPLMTASAQILMSANPPSSAVVTVRVAVAAQQPTHPVGSRDADEDHDDPERHGERHRTRGARQPDHAEPGAHGQCEQDREADGEAGGGEVHGVLVAAGGSGIRSMAVAPRMPRRVGARTVLQFRREPGVGLVALATMAMLLFF